MATDIRSTLAALPLCSTLTGPELDELAQAFVAGDLKEGAWLFRENETASSLFVVVEGKVDVSRTLDGSEHVLARLGNGAVLGEAALLTEVPRSASVKAVSGCTVLELSRARFQTVQARNSLLALKIIAQIADVLARRLALMNDKTMELSRKLGGGRKEDLQEFNRILQAWHL